MTGREFFGIWTFGLGGAAAIFGWVLLVRDVAERLWHWPYAALFACGFLPPIVAVMALMYVMVVRRG